MIFIQGRFNKNVNEDDEFKQQKKLKIHIKIYLRKNKLFFGKKELSTETKLQKTTMLRQNRQENQK